MEKNKDGSYSHRGYLITKWCGVWTVFLESKALVGSHSLGEAREWVNRQFDR